MKWVWRSILGLGVLYAALVAAVAVLTMQPPGRFGRIMKHLPMPVIWALVPGLRIWLWARGDSLEESPCG